MSWSHAATQLTPAICVVNSIRAGPIAALQAAALHVVLSDSCAIWQHAQPPM
jgi:hypothetical protein